MGVWSICALHHRVKFKEWNLTDPKKFKVKDVHARILIRVERIDKMVWQLKGHFSQINQKVVSQSILIKQLETQIG